MSRSSAAPRTAGERRVAADELRARRAQVEDPGTVMEAAAAFLAIRPRSVEEVRRRLRHLGYRHDLGDGVVARLVELGYLDDAAFARAWVESRDRTRPRGEQALRRELGTRGVARDVMDAVLEQRRGADGGPATDVEGAPGEGPPARGDVAAAMHLLERRLPSLRRETDPRRRRQRAWALLARNGFDPETCEQAVAVVLPLWTDPHA